MTLQAHELTEDLTCLRLVGSSGSFSSFVVTEMEGLTVDSKPSHERLRATRQTNYALIASFRSMSAVRQILRPGRRTKISPPIVHQIVVTVVNLMLGPFARHVEPRQSAGQIPLVADADQPSEPALRLLAVTRNSTFSTARRSGSDPNEHPRFRFVVKYPSEVFDGQTMQHGCYYAP